MIEQVRDIVLRAGALMAESGFEIEQKDGFANIVTSSDIAVQDYLTAGLRELVPGCGFFCEEERHHDPDKEYVWIIDPIDGTANYARGIDHCCISVALKHEGEVILGVVYSPWRHEMYSAERGKGAEINGRPLKVSSRSFGDSILCTAMSTYRKQYAAVCSDIIMETYYDINDVRRFGSAAIELCFLAAGHCELYFEFCLQPWDYAAGMLILSEAGGAVCGLDGQLPSLTKPSLVCAANSRENLERLMGTVRKHIPVYPEI